MNKVLFDDGADECQNVAFCSFRHCSKLTLCLFDTKLIVELQCRDTHLIWTPRYIMDSFVCPNEKLIFPLKLALLIWIVSWTLFCVLSHKLYLHTLIIVNHAKQTLVTCTLVTVNFPCHIYLTIMCLLFTKFNNSKFPLVDMILSYNI